MVRVSLRTVTMQIPSQKIITKDNVSIDIAAVAYYHISDPEKAVIVIENVYDAINQISQTTVRNVVGRFSLDQLLSDTASINEQIKDVIDGAHRAVGHAGDCSRDQRHYPPRQHAARHGKGSRGRARAPGEDRRRRRGIPSLGKLGQAADIITQHPVALASRARCRRWPKLRPRRTQPSSSPHNL